jgi:hypothetical protein
MDSSNPVRSIQQAAGGVSGMDADKQAWLAKYTTGPSHDNTYWPQEIKLWIRSVQS